MNSINQSINNLIGNETIQQTLMSEKDVVFAEKYTNCFNELEEHKKLLAFKNVIINDGQCGFAMGGSIQFLLNTDRSKRYRVTIRTFWQQGIESGQSDTIYIMEAGSRLRLGCTDSGNIPVTYYSRQVVGEVVL